MRHYLLLVILPYFLLACAVFGGNSTSHRLAHIKKSPNFKGGIFVNLEQPRRVKGRWKTIFKILAGSERRTPTGPLPFMKPTPRDFSIVPYPFRHLWLGHSTHIIEMDGVRLITDPVLGTYASPVKGIMKRFSPPPLTRRQLPPLDVVCITHDHYDHLEMETVKYLGKRHVVFVVPLGVGAHLEKWGVPPRQIRELDWWQKTRIRRVTIVLTPSRHFSGRSLTDRNTTLWGSYAIIGPTRRVFTSGDGGYGKHFKTIGHRFGPFDLTIMDIGAYGEAWPDIHMTPEEAVKAHKDVRGTVMVPGHYGTFALSTHAWDAPMKRFIKAARTAKIRYALPMPGQFVYPGGRPHPGAATIYPLARKRQ